MLFCSIGVRRAGVPSTCPSSKPLLLPSGQRPEGSHIGSQKGLLQHRSDKSLIRHREEGLRLRPAGGYTQLRIRKREIARAIPAVTQLPIATFIDQGDRTHDQTWFDGGVAGNVALLTKNDVPADLTHDKKIPDVVGRLDSDRGKIHRRPPAHDVDDSDADQVALCDRRKQLHEPVAVAPIQRRYHAPTVSSRDDRAPHSNCQSAVWTALFSGGIASARRDCEGSSGREPVNSTASARCARSGGVDPNSNSRSASGRNSSLTSVVVAFGSKAAWTSATSNRRCPPGVTLKGILPLRA